MPIPQLRNTAYLSMKLPQVASVEQPPPSRDSGLTLALLITIVAACVIALVELSVSPHERTLARSRLARRRPRND